MPSLLFVILGYLSFAQQNHFIYLQTENKQPFYVKLGTKVFSSSVTGYVILSKLVDGEYPFIIGFPKNIYPEQTFNCTIDNNDQGYLIKNFGEKGWGLLNLQTANIRMAGELVKKTTTTKVSDDPFANMLANVVHDSTINHKEVKEEPINIVVNTKVETKDTITTAPLVSSPDGTNKKTLEPSTNKISTDPITNKAVEPIKADITRTSRKKSKDGLQLVYIDKNEMTFDTIRVFIPTEKAEKKKVVQDSSRKEISVEAKDSVVKNTIAPDQPVKPNIEPPVQATKTDTGPPVQVAKTTTGLMVNSDCRANAMEEDFLKLRKKMAAENNEDNMLRVAKKTFKSKCFTTDQVKNLAPLFLKDEGKYSFFETAYPFVSDSGNFPGLESQLSDQYYITRFRAMIHK